VASLQDRLAKAKAEAAAAEAEVSDPAFVAEEQARKDIAEAEARKRAALDRKRSAKVSAAIDFWRDREKVGEVLAVSIDSMPHDFIVTGGGNAAYRAWQKGLGDVALAKVKQGTRQKVDEDEIARAYAVSGILQWNDKIVDERGGVEVSSEDGKALNEFLRNNGAIVTEILNRVSRLDGAAAEERKS
jgi:hypothetical protein